MPESTESEDAGGGEAATDDYPRPPPPSEGQAHQHEGHRQYQDEEQARKEKKQQPFNEKVKEYPHWKAESTRPTRDVQSNAMKVCGASGRIAQPAGKGA